LARHDEFEDATTAHRILWRTAEINIPTRKQ
jgi:hypothetical protein